MLPFILLILTTILSTVHAHSAFFHPSMWGFNVTEQDFPYDNRPVSPLRGRPFSEWWFHNHLAHPPHPSDVFELPAGQAATAEIACHKGATSYHASGTGGDIQDGNNPCPNAPTIAFHSNNINEVAGCALAIAYKSDVNDVQPEDFAVFSVNHTCVWNRFTDFQVPARMPPCPDGGCICSFFWVHNEKGGGEENYMNGFRCKVTGADKNTGVKVARSQVPRRCGKDLERGVLEGSPGNCTYGAKTPFYWVQSERNNMFEGAHMPPQYNDLYAFSDGAQSDIFEDSYIGTIPSPAPGAPVPTLRTVFESDDTSNVPPISTAPPSPTETPTSTPETPTSLPDTSTVSPPTSSNPPPVLLPARLKGCRPRFTVNSSPQVRKRQFGEGVPDCSDLLESRGLASLAKRVVSASRRGRRGLHPSEAGKLWRLW